VKAEYHDPLEATKTELKKLQDANEVLTREKSDLTQRNTTLDGENRTLRTSTTELTSKNTKLSSDVGTLSNEKAVLERAIALARETNATPSGNQLTELRSLLELATRLESEHSEFAKTLKNRLRDAFAFQAPYLIYDFCTAAEFNNLPPKMQVWVLTSSIKWKNCRLATTFSGSNRLSESTLDGPADFQCTLDRMVVMDDYIEDVGVYYLYPEFRVIQGIQATFASGRTVNLFDCLGSPRATLRAGAGNYFTKWYIRSCLYDGFGRVPISISFTNNVPGSTVQSVTNAWTPEPEPDETTENAPSSYRLKGFWGKRGGTAAIERLGVIWEKVS
jgi:hypothetical protein